MTNPDNVGGLNDHKPVPLSEELRIEAAMISGDVYVRGDAFVARMTRMAEQAERLEELCRAAPAGGDETKGDWDDWFETWAKARGMTMQKTADGRFLCPDTSLAQKAHEAGCMVSHMYYLELCRQEELTKDSAPAGSGEVEGLDVENLCALREVVAGTEHWVKVVSLDRAIALLRKLQQGADYVMVPRVPTDEMETAHRMYGDTSDWWQAVIAASQGQEGGNG